MLNDLGITVQSVREVAQERRGLVVISCVMSVAVGRLPRMIAAYRSDRPGVEIHVREGVYASILDDVRSGVADFGISYVDELPRFCGRHGLGPRDFPCRRAGAPRARWPS
jgi:DNA-binding transcriptional LysR family regulator